VRRETGDALRARVVEQDLVDPAAGTADEAAEAEVDEEPERGGRPDRQTS
jgi:hypothetical protein